MTIVFSDRLKLAAYAFLMFVVIWYMIRVLEHQLFDKAMIPTVKEVLPWFCVILSISVILKKNILDSFKHVASVLNERNKTFTLILGIQAAQVIVRFSSWHKMLSMSGQKEPEDEIDPKDIKDF